MNEHAWIYMINWLKDRTHVVPNIPVLSFRSYKNLTKPVK
jgi:hypothetical protein